MNKHFHVQLDEAKMALLHMAAAVDKLLAASLEALAKGDAEAAKSLKGQDDEIDAMECDLDDRCLQMLALDQPVAADLRYIVASMRMSTDLERVGDKAYSITKQIVEMCENGCPGIPGCLLKLADQSHATFRKAVDSFRLADAGLSREVFAMADQAHALGKEVIHTCLESSDLTIRQAMNLVLIGRTLERIVDLSTNIVESIIFVLGGVSIKHQWPPQVNI